MAERPPKLPRLAKSEVPGVDKQNQYIEDKKEEPKKPILVDLDTGWDDAFALFMLISQSRKTPAEFDIVGITTTFGNTSVDNVSRNTWKVLEIANALHIPVFVGASGPLVKCSVAEDPPFHGSNGLGGYNVDKVTPNYQPEPAAIGIYNLAKQYAGKLVIVSMAPLTNLAMAVNIYPEIGHLVNEIITLNGNWKGKGTGSLHAQFNLGTDAEAGQTVLDKYNCKKLFLVSEPREMCKFNLQFRDDLYAVDEPHMKFLQEVESGTLSYGKPTWCPSDVIAAAVIINPKFLVEERQYFCQVELSDCLYRGSLSVDVNNFKKKNANAYIGLRYNVEILRQLLKETAAFNF